MTLEIIIALFAGVIIGSTLLNRKSEQQNYRPSQWLRDAARSGVKIKLKAAEVDGEWNLEFVLDENLEELNRQALELRDSGKKIEAIKLVREQTGFGLKEAKDHVEAL
jgi:hypothetical protein